MQFYPQNFKFHGRRRRRLCPPTITRPPHDPVCSLSVRLPGPHALIWLVLVCLPPAGAYVALTLLGSSPSPVGVSGLQQDPAPTGAPRATPVVPPPPPPPPLPPPQRITGPRPLQVMVPARHQGGKQV